MIRIARDDFPADAPPWLDILLTRLNDAFRKLEDQQKITPFEVVRVTLRTGSTPESGFPLRVALNRLNGNVGGCVVGFARDTGADAAIYEAVWPHFIVASDGNLSVKYITGLDVNTQYELMFLVWGKP